MKIFLSYPSVRRDVAERLKLALEAEGHEVFYDRDDLPPGQTFHREIREAVEDAELFIFLITPESVAPGQLYLDRARARRAALAASGRPPAAGHREAVRTRKRLPS